MKIFLQFVSFCSKKDELKIRKVKKGKIRKYRTCLKEELKSFVKPSRRNCEGETLIYKCMMQTPWKECFLLCFVYKLRGDANTKIHLFQQRRKNFKLEGSGLVALKLLRF